MEENKSFEIYEEEVEVLKPEDVEIVNELSETETTEEPKEEKKSNGINMLLAGAAVATTVVAGIKIFKKVKTNRIKKELGRIKEDLVKQFTEDGTIDEYTEDTLDEMSKLMYFKKHNNL